MKKIRILLFILISFVGFGMINNVYADENNMIVSIDCYLKIDKDFRFPSDNIELSYNLVAAYDYGDIPAPSIGKVIFDSNTTRYSEVQDGDDISLEENQQYMKKSLNIDFSNVFNKPGVYRYILIDETTYNSMLYTSNSYADIYLELTVLNRDDGDGYLLSEYLSAPYHGKLTGLYSEFKPETKEFTFTNYLTGNFIDLNQKKQYKITVFASENKYYKYYININGEQQELSFSNEYNIELGNNEYVKFDRLPSGARVLVEYQNSKDLTEIVFPNCNNNNSSYKKICNLSTVEPINTSVTYSNSITPSTGLNLAFLPFIGLLLIALVVIIILIIRKRNKVNL